MEQTPSRSRRRWRLALPAGLQWRLTAWVAGVLLISAAAVFAVVYLSTGSQIRAQIDRDVSSQTAELSQALRVSSTRDPASLVQAARRALRSQPYNPGSTLLFVIVPGGGVVSNHPELVGFGRPESGEPAAEQAVENRSAARLRLPHLGRFDARIIDIGPVRMFERALDGRQPPVVVGAGESLDLVERAQHSVARAFLLAGALILALALLASYVAGSRVSAPLRQMAGVARRIDGGELDPRLAPADGSGTEIRVLAEAFNRMLDRLQEAFAGQREFVADASHELRTPLTVIRGQLELLAASPHPAPADLRRVQALVGAEIDRVARLVDDLLLLTHAEQREFLHPEPIDVPTFLTELWDGLSLTADRRFELGELPAGTLRADPDRLAQALRNLARNAIEHTADGNGLVRLEAGADGEELVLTVTDDGPGIPPAERERVFERLHRTHRGADGRSAGAGLGLSIVRAIAEAHRGTVHALEAMDGAGARLELRLPGFAPAGNRTPSLPLAGP